MVDTGETAHVASCGQPLTPQLIVPLNPPLEVTVRGIGVIAAPAFALTLVAVKAKLKSALAAAVNVNGTFTVWVRVPSVACMVICPLPARPADVSTVTLEVCAPLLKFNAAGVNEHADAGIPLTVPTQLKVTVPA